MFETKGLPFVLLDIACLILGTYLLSHVSVAGQCVPGPVVVVVAVVFVIIRFDI